MAALAAWFVKAFLGACCECLDMNHICVCVCMRLFLAVSIWLRCRSKRSHHVSDFGWSPRTLCHRQQVNWWVALFLFYLLFSIEGICFFAILLQFWRVKSLAVTINRSAKHKGSKKVKPLARTNLCGNKKLYRPNNDNESLGIYCGLKVASKPTQHCSG